MIILSTRWEDYAPNIAPGTHASRIWMDSLTDEATTLDIIVLPVKEGHLDQVSV